ncbi:TPA: hypothetical protein ACH3X3_014209 [Trebouxia sp. C0006]
MSRQSRSVIRGHLHEGTIGHLRRVCARLQLRANDCSRSQLIEHVLDDARQDQGAYRLLSNFNFDSLVEILKMSDGRVRLLQGMDTRCVMVKILMRWEQWTSGGRRSRSGTEDTDPQSRSLGSRSPPREPVLPPAVSGATPWEVEPVPAKPRSLLRIPEPSSSISRQEGPPKEPRPRSWATGVHGPQVREPDEGAGVMPGIRSDDVGKRGLSDHVHLEEVPRLATAGGSGAVALNAAPDTLQTHHVHLTMPHTSVVPDISHPSPNLEPLPAEAPDERQVSHEAVIQHALQPESASRGEGGAGSPRAGSDAAGLPQSYAAEQDLAYKRPHLQQHSDSEAEERGSLQAWYPGAAAFSTHPHLTTAEGDGALVSQSNEGVCPAWLVDSSTLLPVPPDHANTTTVAGQQVATESDLSPASAPGAVPGAAPGPASRLGPALGPAPGPVPEDDTTLATRPSLKSAISPAPTQQDFQEDAKAVCPIMFATKDEVLQLY